MVSHLLGPGPGRRPRLGVRFYRVCATLQQQLHDFDASPSKRPAQWRALKQIIAHIRSRARVQESLREWRPFLFGYVIAHRSHLVQHSSVESPDQVGVAPLQYQAETGEVCAAIQLRIAGVQPGNMIPERKWLT